MYCEVGQTLFMTEQLQFESVKHQHHQESEWGMQRPSVTSCTLSLIPIKWSLTEE